MKKILYLDFDGVLHPVDAAKSVMTDDGIKVEGEELFRWNDKLKNILDQHKDISIVISSSWRYLHSMDEMKSRLGDLSSYVEDIVAKERGNRFDLISKDFESRGADSFIVLDDDVYAFPENCEQLIACDADIGISDEEVQKKLHLMCSSDLIISKEMVSEMSTL